MKIGKHSHTWLSALSGIIAGQGEDFHEYKIQNGNMIHEEPPRVALRYPWLLDCTGSQAGTWDKEMENVL